MQSSQIYKQILKECFWEYHLDEKDIVNILHSDDMREKKKLFLCQYG